MITASSIARGKANGWGGETCTVRQKSCTVSALQAAVTEIIKFKNPAGSKAWAYIADLFGIKERSAKSRLSNTVSYSIEELQALIHGEDGFEYFEALMAKAEPAWWCELRKTMELARIRGEQALLQQRVLQLDNQPMARQDRRTMKKVINADRKLSTTRAAQETAVGILLADASRSADRAMAPSAAKTEVSTTGARAGGRGR